MIWIKQYAMLLSNKDKPSEVRNVSTYIIKRLAQGLLLIFAVSLAVFSLLYFMPGDPIDSLIGDRGVSEERRDELRAQWGLDQPFYVQYATWVKNILHLDFGTSITTRQEVSSILAQRIPVTVKFCGMALLLELLVAVPVGLLAAYKKGGFFDRLVLTLTSFFRAIPSFWFAILLMLLFGVTWGLLPLSGFGSPKHFILPVASIALGSMAGTIRVMRTEVLEVLRERYVQTAYAKGLPKRRVIIGHVLRNALILITVQVFLAIPWVVSGAVIIENIFVIPGIGAILTKSILAQDFPVVQACILIISMLTVVCNILCDVVTAILDPRIRVEISGGV